MKLLCLHGFLGHSSDFDFLKDQYEILALDLSAYVQFDFETLYESITENIKLGEFHILGYSFGARLAARIYARYVFDNQLYPSMVKNKLICFAGHFGLENNKEKEERKIIELRMMEKIQNLNESEFLNYWNKLEIFQNDEKLETIHFENAQFYFLNYALSNQPCLKSKLLPYREHIHIYYGLNDGKYADYARMELSEFNLNFLPHTGHRILKNKDKILKLLGEAL